MADAMIGYGIGLTGTPKDYTGIVAARERQKATDEIRKKAAKDKDLEGIKKSLLINDRLYMGYQIPEVNNIVTSGIKELMSAKESGDIAQEANIQQKMNQQLLQMSAERKAVDEMKDQYDKRKFLFSAPPSQLYNFQNREEAKKFAEQNPDEWQWNEQLGIISGKPVEAVDLDVIYGKVAKDLKPTMKSEIISRKAPDGTSFNKEVFFYDPQLLAKRLSADFDVNPGIRQNALHNWRINSPKESNLPIEEQKQKAKQWFVEQGLTRINPDEYKNLRKPTQFNVSLSTGGGEKGTITQPMATDSVQIGTIRGEINVPVFGSTATGDIVSTFPTSNDQFYTDDNEKVSGGAVTKATYNQISVGIVANSDIKIPNDAAFLMDYNIPKSVKNYAGQTIKAGQLVDPELKDYLAERGKLRASVITFGNTEDNLGIYRSASLVQQNNWFKANKQKSPEIENLFNTQRQIEQDLTRMYRKDVTKTPRKPTEPPTGATKTGTTTPKTGGTGKRRRFVNGKFEEY